MTTTANQTNQTKYELNFHYNFLARRSYRQGRIFTKTKEAFHFVVDLLAKIGIPPSLPRADCSLWKHGAEHCRTVCLARGSARMPDTTAWVGCRGAGLG